MKVEEKVIAIIEDNIENEYKINLSTNLWKDIIIDSFDTIMIVDALEDEFSVSIKDSDFKKVTDVSDIVNMLKNY